VVRNPIYSTGVGLLLYGMRKQTEGTSMSGLGNFAEEPKTSVVDRLKSWIQGNF
jgi:cell division protein FtsA